MGGGEDLLLLEGGDDFYRCGFGEGGAVEGDGFGARGQKGLLYCSYARPVKAIWNSYASQPT
jgi:hypothetical protein